MLIDWKIPFSRKEQFSNEKEHIILCSKVLFFERFWESLALQQTLPADILSVQKECHAIRLIGFLPVVSQIMNVMEKIRVYLLQGYRIKKDVEYLSVEIDTTMTAILKPSSGVIGTRWMNDDIFTYIYRDISPALTSLAKSVGAVYSEIRITQEIEYREMAGVYKVLCKGGKFTWISKKN